jgi:hypothetical protein
MTSSFRDWCDDDRAPGFRSYRCSPCEDDTDSFYIKNLVRDLNKHKRNLLWNEVEYVHYQYETPPQPVVAEEEAASSPADQDEAAKPTAQQTDKQPDNSPEVNSECLDHLTKNMTAYL